MNSSFSHESKSHPPLVPSEVDLRDFGYMPLDALRLRDSELAIEASPEVFRASVLLWCASWHQVPAGSLPMKDKTLAEYSRAGTRWPKIRDEVLSKWVECSDGRLYHPVVAEKAREAQAAKDAQRARTKAATEAREAKRRSASNGRDDPPRGGRDEQRDEQRDVERDVERDVLRDVEREQASHVVQGKGREGNRREREIPPTPWVPPWLPPDWIPADRWQAFVAMRKAKGKRAPFTEAARDGIVAALDKLRASGHDVGEVLQASVVNGWSGVFAPKVVPIGKGPPGSDLDAMFRRGAA